MKKMILPAISILIASSLMIVGGSGIKKDTNDIADTISTEEISITETKTVETTEPVPDETTIESEETTFIEPEETTVEPEETIFIEPEPVEPAQEIYLSEDELELIAIITMAEAEDQPEYGQRLVIDTILNRLDSPEFPNTIHDVIYSPNQFTCVWNGRADRCYVMDSIYQLVLEECVSRSDYDVMFFCEGGYAGNGPALFQVGGHYFEGTW